MTVGSAWPCFHNKGTPPIDQGALPLESGFVKVAGCFLPVGGILPRRSVNPKEVIRAERIAVRKNVICHVAVAVDPVYCEALASCGDTLVSTPPSLFLSRHFSHHYFLSP